MILVSHDMSFVSQVADKVLFLDKGKIIESGTPEEIMKAPKEERTKNSLLVTNEHLFDIIYKSSSLERDVSDSDFSLSRCLRKR